jgi:hypothetical protein
MAISNYGPSRDEILLDSIYTQIDEIEEEIANLEKIRKQLLIQKEFMEDDYTRKGRMYV